MLNLTGKLFICFAVTGNRWMTLEQLAEHLQEPVDEIEREVLHHYNTRGIESMRSKTGAVGWRIAAGKADWSARDSEGEKGKGAGTLTLDMKPEDFCPVLNASRTNKARKGVGK